MLNSFPDSSVGKVSACNAGDPGLIPVLGRSPGEGKGYPLQYSGLENSMDSIVHGVEESDMTEWVSLSLSSCFLRQCACSVVSDPCEPMGYSLPGSSVHGIFQARILEWVAISFSRGPSQSRDQTYVSCIFCVSRQILYHWSTWESQGNMSSMKIKGNCFFVSWTF